MINGPRLAAFAAKINASLNSHGERFLAGFCIVLLIPLLTFPLVIQTLALPFGYWDYFNLRHLLIPKGNWLSWNSVLPNLWYNLTANDWAFRPTNALFFHVQFLLFGGHFWMWWIIKWSMKALLAFFVYRISVNLTGRRAPSVCAVVFFWFHPVVFEIQLMSTDPLLALLAFTFLYLTWRSPQAGQMPVFRLQALSRARYTLVLIVWILLLGSKEIVLGFCACVLLLLDTRLKRTEIPWFRLFLLHTLFALAAWRISILASRKSVIYTLDQWIARFQNHLLYLAPFDPGTPWFYGFLLLLLGATVVLVIRKPRVTLFGPVVLAGFVMSMTLLSSVPAPYPPGAAPRYVIPMIPFVGIILAYGLYGLPERLMAVPGLLALVFPLLTSSGQYIQHLSNAQAFVEFGQVINYTWNEGHSGKRVYVLDEGEPSSIMYAFLRRYCEVFYGLSPVPNVTRADGLSTASPPAIVITERVPAEVLTSDLPAGVSVRGAIAFEGTKGPGLRVLGERLSQLARLLQNDSRPRYDVGTAVLDSRARWYVYSLDDQAESMEFAKVLAPGGGDEALTFQRLAGGPDVSLLSDTSKKVKLDKGDSIYLTLERIGGDKALWLPGRVKVTDGRLVFGVSDRSKDLWNRIIDTTTAAAALATPALSFDVQKKYRVFFYAPAGAEFELIDIAAPRSVAVRVQRPFEKFGSLPL